MEPLVGRVIQGNFLCFLFFYQAFGAGGENDGHFVQALVGGHVGGVGGVGHQRYLHGQRFFLIALAVEDKDIERKN